MINNMKLAQEMWEKVKTDATTKSTLYLISAEDQLANMQLNQPEDSSTHLTKLKHHFELMTKHNDNLTQMGSTGSWHWLCHPSWSYPLGDILQQNDQIAIQPHAKA